MLNSLWSQFLFDLDTALTGALFSLDSAMQTVRVHFSIFSLIDLVLVFALLWWLYRKLRRTDLIKILPRLFFVLVIMLVGRLFGLWALYYVAQFLLVCSVVAIGAMYAPEIKNVLEIGRLSGEGATHKPVRASTGDIRGMIRIVTEAVAVLTRSQTPALILIRTDKPVNRLIETGTKLHAKLTLEFLLDIFSTQSELSKGAVVIDGNRIVAAGSTLLKPKAKVLFNPNNPDIRQAARELHLVAIVLNKTFGDITLIQGENSYKNLSPTDLEQLLSRLLVDKAA